MEFIYFKVLANYKYKEFRYGLDISLEYLYNNIKKEVPATYLSNLGLSNFGPALGVHTWPGLVRITLEKE